MIFPTDALAQEALTPLSLAGALVIGVAFGFVLERAGFGRAQILVAQFYGTKMTVYRTMFTAVVTAAIGTSLLAAVGLLDLRAVTINYPTYLWPMIVGGLLVGAGFVTSGYCPGTSVVAAASGKLDGAFTVLGVVLGTVLYAEVQPALGAFHDSGKLGGVFLYTLLRVPPLVLALLAAVVAYFTFKGAARIEALVNRSAAARAAASPPQA
ncbi:MAG: YeeE/YedE family protein [Anaeromyxobacter sp.]|nr:YeeE/YedE family protein [Anaeromyxobacter sp.]